MTGLRIALVCCRETAGGAPDDAPLAAALERAGATVEHTPWDDARVDWSSFDVALLRSTWDYHLRAGEFFAWLERAAAATRVVHPPDLVRWNADKRYLMDLERAGVPVTPTAIVAPGEVASLTGLLGERGWERFVLKPVVSATAFGTARFTGDEIEAASAHLEGLLERGPALVQRYEPAIEREGERSIMVIGGEATHCVVKRPVAGDFRCQSDFGGSVESAPLTAGDAALALRAVAAAPIAPSYARVDVIDAPDGARLMELELIEPELFFLLSEVAVHRMVDEVMRRARSPERKLGDSRTPPMRSSS